MERQYESGKERKWGGTDGIVDDLETLDVGSVIVGDLPEQFVAVVVRAGHDFVDHASDEDGFLRSSDLGHAVLLRSAPRAEAHLVLDGETERVRHQRLQILQNVRRFCFKSIHYQFQPLGKREREREKGKLPEAARDGAGLLPAIVTMKARIDFLKTIITGCTT